MTTVALKPIPLSGVREMLERAEQYRLKGEHWEAQTLCEAILRVDRDNQEALILLVLTMSDQIRDGVSAVEARQVAARMSDEYQRYFYAGLICERAARATLRSGQLGSERTASALLTEAMHWFGKAEEQRPHDKDEAILRWNACARIAGRTASPMSAAEISHEITGE